MPWTRIATLVIALVSVSGFAQALSQPPFEVQKGHPRIYFNDANRDALIAKAKNHPHFRVVQQAARAQYHARDPEGVYNAWAGALVALVNNDAATARKVIDFLLKYEVSMKTDDLRVGRMNRSAAHAYDWVYNFMSDNERKEAAKKLIEAVKIGRAIYKRDAWSAVNNHGAQQVTADVVAMLAAWEHGGKDELWPWAYDEFTRKYILSQKIMGPYGGWFEGNAAYIEGFLVNCYHAMDALRSACGVDYYKDMLDVIRGSGYFAAHSVTPDGQITPWADSDLGKLSWKAWWVMAKGAKETRDPELQWFAKKYEAEGDTNSGWSVASVLMYDPTIPAKQPTRVGFTTGQRPDGVSMGYAFMRTGYTDDAVHVVMRCGDYFGHHNHADSNAFTIFWRGAEIAKDEGYQKGLESKDSSHHNTLSIQGCSGRGGRGSQRFYHVGEPMSPQEVLSGKSRFEMGDLVAFQETDAYVYACGDASEAYSPRTHFLRHFLLVKPDTLVIADNVERPNTWNMQTECKASVEGQFVRLKGKGGAEVTMHVAKGGPPRIEGKWVRFDSQGDNLVVFKFGQGTPVLPDCTFSPTGGGVFAGRQLAARIENPFPGSVSAPPTALAAAGQSKPGPGEGDKPAKRPWKELNAELLAEPIRLMGERMYAQAAEGLRSLQGKVSGEGAAAGLEELIAAADSFARMKEAIVKGAAPDRKLQVFIDFGGAKARAMLTGAADDALAAEIMGQPVPLMWTDLNDGTFHRLAAACMGEDAQALIDQARFCAMAGLFEAADEAATKARRIDHDAAKRIEEVLKKAQAEQ